MTTLKKAVTRRVDADHGRVPIAITIHPEGFLTFREKGNRRSYTLSIMYAYRLAVQSDKREH